MLEEKGLCLGDKCLRLIQFGSGSPNSRRTKSKGSKMQPSLLTATHYCTFRTSRIANQPLRPQSSSKNLISQVAPLSSSYHEIFISVWGQHQRDDDLVTEQWCLFMLQDLVQSVQLSREQGKAVQDRWPGGGKKVSECSR